jgi:hypothetical protein
MKRRHFMEWMRTTCLWSWRIWTFALLAGILAMSGSSRAAVLSEVERDARKVLAKGQSLPPGMTLKRSRIAVDIVITRPDRPDKVRVKRLRMISGSYELAGDLISFQVIRGKRRRERHPDSPKYHMDVCYRQISKIHPKRATSWQTPQWRPERSPSQLRKPQSRHFRD